MLEVYISENTGAAVKLFMGTFRAATSGTAERADETFRPQKGRDHRTPVRDHTISLHFEKDQQFSEALQNMKLNRLSFVTLIVISSESSFLKKSKLQSE